jgi:predicted component of type VI protein secretion system
MPTLTIQLPGHSPVSHVLKDETITIGRLKSNTIVIEDSSISLMHAKITRKDGQFYLKDLNSTNGTIVNGQPIGEVRLRDQDRVRFAEITTQFNADGEVLPNGPPRAASMTGPAALPAPIPTPASAAPPVSPAKAASPAPSKPQRKLSPRALAVAAAVVAVALPGIGVVIWKSVKAKRQNQLAYASNPTAPKPSPPAPTQVNPRKPPVEAKPVPEASEVPAAPGPNIAAAIEGLKSKEAAERRQAALVLHGAGTDAKEAIPALKQALKDSDQEVQMWAALALVNTQTYDKAIIPILIRALKSDNTVLRQVACLSLGLIPYEPGDKQTVLPALTEAADKDADDEVRRAAKSALSIVEAK